MMTGGRDPRIQQAIQTDSPSMVLLFLISLIVDDPSIRIKAECLTRPNRLLAEQE